MNRSGVSAHCPTCLRTDGCHGDYPLRLNERQITAWPVRYVVALTALPLTLAVGSGAVRRYSRVTERGVTTHVLVCQGGRRAYTMLIMHAHPLIALIGK
jgi:hypothetical protein